MNCQCLLGCDGVHSATRNILSVAMKPRVLDYVVFNGKRRVSHLEYKEVTRQDRAILEFRKDRVRLEIAINDVTDSYVDLSYTYSRPARTSAASGRNDVLHKPARPSSGATDIPEELYEEVAALEDLEPPFAAIFDAGRVRKDRVLHWLMRGVQPDLGELARLAGHGVALVGDAVHATPILGGDGANTAIQDGMELADYIAANGVHDLARFAESKFDCWIESVGNSERRLEHMHQSKDAHL